VLAVNEAAARAIKRARKGEGPTILELKTYRRVGHSRNDACGYRSKEEEKEWFARDPVYLFRKKLIKNKIISETELAEIEKKIENEIEESVEYAQNAPFPAIETALNDIFWQGGYN
jgi:TPP-dependent pyruvate/acetoin dehydrogenase alpha subunit